MAATAVYARIAGVPVGGKTVPDGGKAFANISATTSAFVLNGGGLYCVSVKASTYGSVALQMLLPDDVTWVAVSLQSGVTAGAAVWIVAFVADNYGLAYLPSGTYRIVLA